MAAIKRKSTTSSAAKPSPAKKPYTPPSKSKSKPPSNGSILSFFKKTESLCVDGSKNATLHNYFKKSDSGVSGDGGYVDKDFFILDVDNEDEVGQGSPSKKVEEDGWELPAEEVERLFEEKEAAPVIEQQEGLERADERMGCTPPPPDIANANGEVDEIEDGNCPFTLEEEMESNPDEIPEVPFVLDEETEEKNEEIQRDAVVAEEEEEILKADILSNIVETATPVIEAPVGAPPITRLDTDDYIENELEMYDEEQYNDEIEDDEDEMGEEMINRRYMEENLLDDEDFTAEVDDDELKSALGTVGEVVGTEAEAVSCPICTASLKGIKEGDITKHVNACLDGKPIPLPPPLIKVSKKQQREPRIGKVQKFNLDSNNLNQPQVIPQPGDSAFSKIMVSHAEDRAWASAAQNDAVARGKRGFQRTCPFYKIMPNLSCAVDAFRYGAVPGMNAYFLSHFHSDHYIGLSASWCHGPIYCSRVTANLCRRQLRVDPKWMIELEYDVPMAVPGTGGATVTMIDANHCPGSSLFLLEKEIPNGRGGKRKQRILHCGDFRAHAKHLRHPLLSVLKGNRIDICYLDTTYMNPKYAFPPQQQVIDVCAELCVSLMRSIPDMEDNFEKTRKEKGIAKFVQQTSDMDESSLAKPPQTTTKQRGKLLIVVGTYSIGKERICMGIARALDCKIFAPPNKQRICAALEDAELTSRLTTDPYAAQVHMTPLMEIRAETLRDYLQAYKPGFSRIVGFRPSGWNYRPPNSRFTESPSVQTVLNSMSWRSEYHIDQLSPQRGSTTEARCYGVPYSEHSSFRELTTFCCALDIVKIVPTVNVGSAKMREKMKIWFDKWAAEKKKNGFHQVEDNRHAL